jgi:hypothetical protein
MVNVGRMWLKLHVQCVVYLDEVLQYGGRFDDEGNNIHGKSVVND